MPLYTEITQDDSVADGTKAKIAGEMGHASLSRTKVSIRPRLTPGEHYQKHVIGDPLS